MTTAVRDLAVHRRASPFGMVSTATAGLDLFVDLRALRQWRDIFERDGYKNHAATASDLLAWIDQDSRNYR